MEKGVLTKKGWHFTNNSELTDNQLLPKLACYDQWDY